MYIIEKMERDNKVVYFESIKWDFLNLRYTPFKQRAYKFKNHIDALIVCEELNNHFKFPEAFQLRVLEI